jgi:hypothetical protein
MRYELSDYEWTTIKPMLPNKPRGVRRVNDRRVLNGIFGSSVQVRHGAQCREPLGEGAAEPASRAGHQCDLARQRSRSFMCSHGLFSRM